MNKSTKQTLLSSWIRGGAAGGGCQAAPAPFEKRKREEPLEPEEEERAASLNAEAVVDGDNGRRDDNDDDDDDALDLDLHGNAPAPPSSSSSSESEPDLEEEENEHGVDEQGLTAYEREREALIARNREALAALGVASAAQALSLKGAAAAPKPRRRASGSKRRTSGAALTSSAAFPEDAAARRSSLRPRRGGVAAASAAATEGGQGGLAALPRQRTPTPEPETYDNRIVLSYVIGTDGGARAAEEQAGGREERARGAQTPALPPSSLRRLPLSLSGPVVRAYSVSASRCGSLLAAGGKDGWACIWGLRGLSEGDKENDGDGDDEDEDGEEHPERRPLLEARLHRSWIADVALVPSSSSSSNGGRGGGRGGGRAAAPLLLTAANDGTLAVHDTGAAAEQKKKGGAGNRDADAQAAASAGAPRRLASAVPHGGSGIFSMAVAGSPFSATDSHVDVATASKDGSLVISRIENGGGEVRALATIEDAHGGGVAKCVRWRDGSTLASCGNDGAARLWDARCPYGGGGGGGAAVEIAQATVGGVAANVVRWRRGDENGSAPSNHLLVAGTNPEALMFDVRSPRGPLFALKPPPAPSSGRGSSSAIYQPCFTCRGAAVAVGLPRSGIVSLFDAGDGTPLSRGGVGEHDASTLSSFETGEGTEVVAAVGTRCLHLFSPAF